MSIYEAIPGCIAATAVTQALFILSLFLRTGQSAALWTSSALWLLSVVYACSFVPKDGMGFLVEYFVFSITVLCIFAELAFGAIVVARIFRKRN